MFVYYLVCRFINGGADPVLVVQGNQFLSSGTVFCDDSGGYCSVVGDIGTVSGVIWIFPVVQFIWLFFVYLSFTAEA